MNYFDFILDKTTKILEKVSILAMKLDFKP